MQLFPVRGVLRRLAPMVLSGLFPLTAFAQANPSVCANSRPNWDVSDGAMTMIEETLYLLTTPGILALLIALAMALRFRNLWFTFTISLLSFVICYLFYVSWASPNIGSVVERSIVEGCVGPPYGAMMVLTLIGTFAIFWQFYKTREQAS